MPTGDEGTGLHAFDDLDPISTVSALNVMPDEVMAVEPARTPGAVPRSAPPPPPGRRLGTLPQASDGGASSGVRSAPPPPPFTAGSGLPPPPPRGGAAGRSVPPPVARMQESVTANVPPVVLQDDALQDDAPPEENDGDEDTRVVANAFAHDPEFAEAEGLPHSADGNGQFEDVSATAVAANIDMDWDEEDVATKLRDEEHDGAISDAHVPVAGPYVAGRPSPFPAAPLPSPYGGNPSPFAVSSHGVYGGERDPNGWETEEEAQTRVMSGYSMAPAPALPAGMSWGDSLTPASNTASTVVGGQASGPRVKVAWVGLAAAALIGAAFGARTLLGNAEPGTVTLVTKPADAEVLVDGKLLTGQSSPFTVQQLAAGKEHAILVRKPGFAEQTHHFQIEDGELKELPNVELAPLRIDTGFALTSVPEGAAIYVDEEKLDVRTPARITDLKPGLHVIKLVSGDDYQPWETQVALASGQVIELPTARLVAGGKQRVAKSGAGPVAYKSSGSSRQRGSDDARPREQSTPIPVQPRAPIAVQQRPAMAPAPRPVMAVAPAPQALPKPTGNQGTLRINSRPWSQVYVDGRMVGNTPQMAVPLSPGSHNIKLVNPQLGMTKKLKVKIQNGKATTKIVELMEE